MSVKVVVRRDGNRAPSELQPRSRPPDLRTHALPGAWPQTASNAPRRRLQVLMDAQLCSSLYRTNHFNVSQWSSDCFSLGSLALAGRSVRIKQRPLQHVWMPTRNKFLKPNRPRRLSNTSRLAKGDVAFGPRGHFHLLLESTEAEYVFNNGSPNEFNDDSGIVTR
jgi:hypothetical protein